MKERYFLRTFLWTEGNFCHKKKKKKQNQEITKIEKKTEGKKKLDPKNFIFLSYFNLNREVMFFCFF